MVLGQAPSRDAPMAPPKSEGQGARKMIDGRFDEMERFWEPDHVQAVRRALESNFDGYFDRYCRLAPIGGARFAKGAEKRAALRAARKPAADLAGHLTTCSKEAITRYKKEAVPYRSMLEPECLEAYADQCRIFADEVAKHLPVIHKALNGSLEEMVWWKKRFRRLLKGEAERLHRLFVDLVVFAESYGESRPAGDFLAVTEPWELALEPMNAKPRLLDEEEWEEEIPEEEGEGGVRTLSIPGTVSVGITSMVLHHLDGRHFAPRTRHMLAALYFLTGQESFGLRSESSEFLLWSVKSGSLGHNHHYPYPLFMVHVITAARLLRDGYGRLGVPFAEAHAMVLTANFLQFVADEHAPEVAKWKGESEC
jgi:hypothetical protein